MRKPVNRMDEVLNYNYEKFKLDMEDLTEDYVEIYEEAQRNSYPGIYRDAILIDNYIKSSISNKIASEPYTDTVALKLLELGMIFNDENYWNMLNDPNQEELSASYIAFSFNTNEANVKMKRVFDEAREKLKSEKQMQKLK